MLELSVTGMTCGHCVRAVTDAVKALDPEAEVQVDLGSKRVRVEGRSSAVALIGALGAAGYPARAAEKASLASEARKDCCGCG
jgi:copper chaperone CopZ